MAKVTIQTHNATVRYTASSTTFTVTYTDCTPVSAEVSGGTFTPSVSLSSGNLVIQWAANTSTAGRACIIVVTAQDTQGNNVRDVMAFNQNGSSYNVSVSGSRDVDGNSGSGSYSITTTAGGTIGVYSDATWIDVNSVTKTGSNTGTALLTFDRNHNDTRFGIVRVVFSFQNNPYNATYYMVLTQGTYVEQTSTLSYTPNSANVGYDAGSFTSVSPAMSNVGNLGIQSRSGNMTINSASIESSTGRLIVSYGANNGSTTLEETFVISGTGLNGTITTTFSLYQGSYSYAVNPIWKTTTVEVQGRSYVDYTVSTDGYVVYSGRAYQLPDTEEISFELNEIVRDYIDNTLWWREGYQTPSGWQRTFTVELDNGTTGDYIFTKDWSYVEKGYSSSSFICLNDPIINEIPVGCFVPVCVFSPQKAGNVIFTTNDELYTVNLNNPRQARYLSVSTPGRWYGYVDNTFHLVYEGVADCKSKYVVYYENAFGGIDAMPIQGNVLQTDKITSYTTKNAVRVPSNNFSYRRYLNQISPSWELRTGYLSDEQASKMHHLIESTLVYLYDIEKAEVYPVVIDDSSVQYKTFKNQGRKFFNYTFNVRSSQDKIRK